MSSVGGTSVGAPGGTFAPPALTNGMPLGILKCDAYTCAAEELFILHDPSQIITNLVISIDWTSGAK